MWVRLPAALPLFRACGYNFGTFCPQVGAQDEGLGLSYAPCLPVKPVLLLRFHAAQAQPCFPCRFKRPCPPRRQRHLKRQPGSAYDAIRFACKVTRQGGQAPLPPQEEAACCPLRDARRPSLLGGPPAGSVEQKSAWDWCGILSFGELLSPACLQRDGKEKPKSTEKRFSPRAAPPQQCPAAPRPYPSRRCPLSFLPVTYGKRRGMQRGCAPFPYVQGTRPRRRTGLAAAAGERMAGRALTGRRSPLYDGFPTGRRPPAREPRRASSARARAAVPRGGRAARQGAAAGPIRCGGRPGPA